MAKRILLVNNNCSEVEAIKHSLDNMKVDYSLYDVSKGQDALNILMGSSQGFISKRSGQARPDIILLNKTLPDMTGVEFLKIVRKYYSLKSVKVFMLIDSITDADQSVEELEFSGYLEKPKEDNLDTFQGFELLRPEFNSTKAYMAFVPVAASSFSINNVIQKIKILQLGRFTILKIVGCSLFMLVLIGAKTYKKDYVVDNANFGTIEPTVSTALDLKQTTINQSENKEHENYLPVKETPSVPVKPIKKQSVILRYTDSLNYPENIASNPLKTRRLLKIKVVEEPDSNSIR